jgi:multiple sugar transport system substrate-binding protein
MEVKKMKRSIFLFWCILVIYIIFGSSIVFGETKISLWEQAPQMTSFYEKAARDYQEIHPDVEIEVLCVNVRDFEQKLSVTIPINTAADIVGANNSFMSRFIEAGCIDPNPPDIDAMFREEGHYSQWTINHALYNDITYGIPIRRSTPRLFWNKKMFAEEGLFGPPTNWEEVNSYAQKLARYDADGNLTRSGISHRLSGAGSGVAEKWWFWLYSAGGNIIEEYPDGKYRDGYDNEAGREALKFHIDHLYKYHVDDHKVKHDTEAFALELTAMFIREAWVIPYMLEYSPHVEYDTAQIPGYKRYGIIEQDINLYVTKSSKNKEIAWDFIKFLSKPEYQIYILETMGYAPVREDLDYSTVFEKFPQYKSFVEKPENFGLYGAPILPYFDEIETRLAERLVDAYMDKTLLDNPEGIAKVIHEAAEETNNILKENDAYHEE